MNIILKNRLLCEHRFFLNKSNTKWLSTGIVPGYAHLNGKNFEIGFRIGDDGSVVPFAMDELKSLLKIFKSIGYFTKYATNAEEFELTKGILISEFQMGGSPCYKIVKQKENKSISIGMNSVEELLQMENIIFAYAEKINVKSAEQKFFTALEIITAENFELFLNEVVEEPDIVKMDLLLNFNEFVIMCGELKKANSASTSSGAVTSKGIANMEQVQKQAIANSEQEEKTEKRKNKK